MDNRLDFTNETRRHLKTLTEDDTLLIIAHNKKEGDLFYTLFGDWEDISIIMSNKNVVNHEDGSEDDFNKIKKLILNTSLNICNEDPNVLKTLLKGLKKIKNKKDGV